MSCAVLSTVITAQTQITHRFAPKTPSGVPLQLLMDHSELSDRPWQRLRLATDPIQPYHTQQQQQQHATYQRAAPARPLSTPQERWRGGGGATAQHGTTAAEDDVDDNGSGGGVGTQPDDPVQHGLSAAAASSTTRCLACAYRAGVLGIAAYDRLSNELFVLETADESKGPGAFQMLQYIKLQLDPQIIILSATADPALIEAAKLPAATAAGAASTGDGSSAEPTVQLQRPSLFVYNKALQMVNAIQVRGQHQHQQQYGLPAGRRRTAAAAAAGPAAGLIDTSAQQQVAALGALAALMLQMQQDEGAGDGVGSLLVDGISELQLDGHLVVDGASLAALDIFKEEEHPSAMGIGSSKEGVSVYGLLQRCVTGMGRRLLRQWFLRPVVQLDVVSGRHDTLELLVAAPTTNDALRASMKKLQDLPRLLAKLRLCQARPQLSAFKQLHASINQLLNLRAAVAALAPRAAAAQAAAAAAGGAGDAAAGAVRSPVHGASPEQPQAPRSPGWLLDAAGAAASGGGGQPAAGATNSFFSPFMADSGGGGGLFGNSSTRMAAAVAGRGAVGAGGMFSTAGGSSRGVAPGADAAAWSTGVGADHATGAAGRDDGLPAAGPWDKLSITRKLLSCISAELSSCCCMIADVLDLSCALEGCLVQPGVCEPLDELRQTLDQLPTLLTQVMEQELMRVPANIARRHSKQLWGIIYIPQVGFVISISGGKLTEDLLDILPDYNLAFMGEDGAGIGGGAAAGAAGAGAAEENAGVELDRGCAYYTCDTTRQLNTQYGDLQHKIQDLEASICTELIKRLLQFGPALTAAATAVAELDCLCSLAAAARDLGYCRPQLVQESVIHIEGGRHPLAELLAPGRFIDNDTTLGGNAASAGAAAGGGGARGSNPRMLLITGPNASGKSVYMKQVALLVYMAHIGSFIPAHSAVIGLTDRILTRLPGMESVAQHTSSFKADLAQVSNILTRATSRSLVLLDEFGKGTLSADGVGLLAALLQHYAAQPSPPLLLACTHFSELLDPGILPRSPQLALCTMQVLVGDSSAGSRAGRPHEASGGGNNSHSTSAAAAAAMDFDQEHVFLYKLVPGAVASSYGLHCARLCGVDCAVLTRAADVLALQEAGQPITRLQVPQLEERDRVCWQMVQQLAALNMSNQGAVKQLMATVVKAEAVV